MLLRRRDTGIAPYDAGIVPRTIRSGNYMEKIISLKKRKQTHLKEYDYSNTYAVYFVTLCVHAKQPHFKNPETAVYIADEINYRAHTTKEVLVLAYCIMPDHVHLLIKLNQGYGNTLQNWVAAFKRYTARLFQQSNGVSPLWQKNFYEHVVREEESLEQIAEYIVHNPVRKNMVNDWKEYCFSKIDYDAFQ